jgi:hypothetical protein
MATTEDFGTDDNHCSDLLDTVYRFTGRFVAYPSEHAHVAHALWIAHAHLMDAWESTPRLAFLSPEPASGKTRALEISELLVPNAVEAINVTPAYLFRKVGDDKAKPTILYDEIDTVFGPKAKENEEIRGLLNAGHRRGAVAGRCVVRGKTVTTEDIPAYCAVALAGLGWLPDTILTRAVIIRMRRRAPNEKVTAFRRRVHAPDGHKLRGELAAWAAKVVDTMAAARPAMPPGIEDRNADVWEPRLAIADAIGGDWPQRARDAAVALVATSAEAEPSLGVRLLADMKTVFDQARSGALPTAHILTALIGLPESPWGDLRGKPITDRALSTRLRQYGIRSKSVRIGDRISKGYTREDFHDAWLRYLPPSAAGESATSATGATNPGNGQFSPENVADVADSGPDVADTRDGKSSINSSDVTDVADVADARGNGHSHGFGRVYAVHNHPTRPGEVRSCDHCGVGGRLAKWDWPGRTVPVWLHEKCEETFAAANKRHQQPPTTASKSPGSSSARASRWPVAGSTSTALRVRADRRPALGPVGDCLDDFEPPFGGTPHDPPLTAS